MLVTGSVKHNCLATTQMPGQFTKKKKIHHEDFHPAGAGAGVSPGFWHGIQMDHGLALAALTLEKKAA